ADAVPPEWRGFFADLDEDARGLLDGLLSGAGTPPAAGAPVDDDAGKAAARDSGRAPMPVRRHRVRGPLEADLDPLGLVEREAHPELDYRTYGFVEADLDRTIYINNVLGRESATLREIVSLLRNTYCGKIGVEFMHIQEPAQKIWIQERVE